MGDNQHMERTEDHQRLIGREPVLATLRSCAETAARGRGQLLLVTGEAGIGKTALFTRLAGEAAATGARVMWGQCWDGDGTPAFWPWVQVLRAGIAAGDDPGHAAVMLPETSAPPAHPGDSVDARFQLFDAVASFLARLAEQQPVVVFLDDLHWADDGSLRLLEFAARHLAAHAVLLLGAYRDEEAGPQLRELARSHDQLQLQGLSSGDVAGLMTLLTGTAPSPAVAGELWRRTGGNPFMLGELTRLLVAQGGSPLEMAPPSQLLASVGDILERRLARLSNPCVDLVTVAAVVGPEVPLDVLVLVADEAYDVAALLHEAVAARVLAEPATPVGPYRFTHDLFRETIVSGMPTQQQVRLHLAVGRALESLRDRGGSVHPAELASHFQAAATGATTEAVRYGIQAAEDATARMAFEEARAHYERVLALLELAPGPDPDGRLDLLLQLGEACNRAGDAEDAHTAYRDAAELARRLGDSNGMARAALGIHGLGWRHVHTEAIAILEEAVRGMPDEPSDLGARVLAALARELYHSVGSERDWGRAPVLAQEAVHAARKLGDPGTLAFCLLALHDARWRPGTALERLVVVDEMLAASHAAKDRDMAAQARLLRATALIELGDPEGLIELEQYCRVSDELGHARARYGALSRRATAALVVGDLGRAGDLALEAFRLGESTGEPDARGVYETLMLGITFAGGERHPDGPAPGSPGDAEPWPGLPMLEALLYVAAGDLAAAARTLERIRLDDLPRTYDLELLTLVVHAVTAAGTDEQRRQADDLLRAYTGSHVVVGGCASYYGAVDHHLGGLARSAGRHEEARRHFESAAALHDRLGARGWAELSRSEAAACHAVLAEQAAVFRRDGDVWTVVYQGTESHFPDSKGLRDLAVLLGRPGQSVHAVELHTGAPPATGADPVLDDRAKVAYRRRLLELEQDIDEAEAYHDSFRAERARAERDTLMAELSGAVGLGGRDRRLGDERERARKAVSGRIRDALIRIDRADPELGRHLRGSVQTGTWCTYAPTEHIHWRP
ncbi:MAG: AAA family ATPase [Actinobacteria bacterium]|nr:AAA family ATPase [Actinomycetota bacterium]